MEEPMIQIYDYKDNNEYRASFNRLMELVYGINFEQWYEKGCWDDHYICHSMVHNNEVIANISVGKMDLIINGVNRKAIQIGTVMTHPDYRGKGLSKQLMNEVLAKYELDCDFFLLFANSSVLDFYPKFGFSRLAESQFKLKWDRGRTAIVKTSLRKLSPSNHEDFEFIKERVSSRIPISERFGSQNDQWLVTFYAINVFPEHIYYSKEDDAIIVYGHEGETLHLYDVVSRRKIDFNRLITSIANEHTETIRFHFTPDPTIEGVRAERIDETDDVLFVKPNFDLGDGILFCVPKLAHA